MGQPLRQLSSFATCAGLEKYVLASHPAHEQSPASFHQSSCKLWAGFSLKVKVVALLTIGRLPGEAVPALGLSCACRSANGRPPFVLELCEPSLCRRQPRATLSTRIGG